MMPVCWTPVSEPDRRLPYMRTKSEPPAGQGSGQTTGQTKKARTTTPLGARTTFSAPSLHAIPDGRVTRGIHIRRAPRLRLSLLELSPANSILFARTRLFGISSDVPVIVDQSAASSRKKRERLHSNCRGSGVGSRWRWVESASPSR
jgi:hypothetical protein